MCNQQILINISAVFFIDFVHNIKFVKKYLVHIIELVKIVLLLQIFIN